MSNSKIKWGILSTAKIGRTKVIPGIQKSELSEVVAICSRNQENAERVAKDLGIPKAYGSYEALLADTEIDAIYNPLPNHLHVSWTIKALEAGKHVLCEKPIGMDTKEVETLMEACKAFPTLKVMEAFMYRFHPQWVLAKELVDEGRIGEVKIVQSFFSYFNNDPKNIRNQAGIGGGGLMDIGCYCISFPRFIFGQEPQRVVGLMDYDPELQTDRFASGMMDFSEGKSSHFTCSTQLMSYQRCVLVGSKGTIEIEIPVNAPADSSCKIKLNTSEGMKEIQVEVADQYALQAQAFATSIFNNMPAPTPLTDAFGNMKVIDAMVRSHKKGTWVEV